MGLRARRTPALVLASTLALFAVAESVGSISAGHRVVPIGSFLVGDVKGRLLVLDRSGVVVHPVPGRVGSYGAQGIALAADRRRAFVAVPVAERPSRLFTVDLETGRRRMLAEGLSPTVSPDGTRLAFLLQGTQGRAPDVILVTALVVLDLRTGRSRSFPLRPAPPRGTPPGLIVNWSPDGRRIVLFDGARIRLVRLANAGAVTSQPVAPASKGSRSPVFLDAGTLVVLDGCCIGPQQLTAITLATRARRPFATLPAPTESLQRVGPGVLLAVTADQRLLLVTKGGVRSIATGIVAATS